MNREEQLKKMRLEINGDETDKSKDNIFESKLDDAEMVILNTLYPYDNEIKELPNNFKIKNWQVRCAIELYNAKTRKGVQSYSENGFSVSYLTSLLSDDLMRELPPSKAGIPK